MTEILTKEKIFAAPDRPTVRVSVPEWGGDVFVRTMDGGLRATYEELLRGIEFPKLRATIVALTAADESGQPLFSEADIDALHAKSGAALDRVFAASIRLNRLRKSDLEDLEKNSESGPNDSSHSD